MSVSLRTGAVPLSSLAIPRTPQLTLCAKPEPLGCNRPFGGDLSRCVAQSLRARPSMGVQAPVDCKHVGWIVVDLKKNSSTLDARVKATRLANEFATHSVLEAVTTHQE